MGFWHFLFVRAALVYLIYTALLGTLFYLFPGLQGPFRSSHVHAGLVGFFLQMVMGVAYWMMPRPGGLRQDRLEGLTFVLLNAGLLLRLVLEPLYLLGQEGLRPWLGLSGGLQLLATLVFAFAMHRRVVTGDMLRKMREERERRGG
ncbi:MULTISPECIES: hypothetical protein [Thermus]|uniref:Cytochrome C and Quinol oxidase polypeptide I n=2 Tax=Thermus TaxID=270 RepID=A0ABY7RNT4_9DEIN|nr:hypothetical protein [Thermus antranikianii]MBW6393650.1 hypothetical protein [Thermus brevis]QWK21965.1 MAG: hypothetical protein KNN15_00280 [Thermus antranikianii]WCM39365.1 hypothetical protein GO600_04235 [Thermus antranikianii]